MTIFNPDETTHILQVIPRDYKEISTVSLHTLQLYNEDNRAIDDFVDLTILTVENGYVRYEFDKTFSEGQTYQIKITDNLTENIIFRGKAFCTSKSTQNYAING